MAQRCKTIALVTTSRADYGIYRPLLEALRFSGRTLHLLVGGTHPVRKFGHTLDEIRADAFGRVHVINHHADADRGIDLARSAGQAVQRFAAAMDECAPDLCFVLGDRYEMLAAGLAAAILRIPLAHLHGGDRTEGSTDDQFRHALTKLSHVHFPAIRAHASRIIAMGEERWRVHVVGALALDLLRTFRPEPPGRLLAEMNFDPQRPTLVLAYHPEPLASLVPAVAFRRVAGGLDEFDGNVLVVGTNADEGHLDLSRAILRWVRKRPLTAVVASLPQHRFWSWLSAADLIVGNSSASVIEAASFAKPVVDIGDRQKGRVRAANVINAACDPRHIARAVRRVRAAGFRSTLTNLKNPYGDGHAAERILAAMASLPPRETLLRKRWA